MTSMKAVRIHAPGGVGALALDDIAIPEPGAGQVRVKLSRAGLNFIDIYQRMGLYKLPLPATMGNEGAGVVDALGEGVSEVKVGQRVAFNTYAGSYAEYALVPAWKLVPLPDEVDDDTATALMLQGMTAHYLARSTHALREGETCLVHAAAGGVGALLTQLARLAGARVIATAGSAEKADLARAAGADEVILYREQDFEAEVRRLTDGQGVDVVYDSVGRDTFLGGLNVLRPRGTMVLYGAASGPVEALDPQLLNQKGGLFLTRPSLAHYTLTREELLMRAGELFELVSRGELQVRVDRIFPLAQAAEAQQYMEARQTKGKVLLHVG